MIISLIQSMGLGILFGFVFGKRMVIIINKIKLHIEGLYSVLTIALMLLNFSVTYYIGGNRFLSVYIAAMILEH